MKKSSYYAIDEKGKKYLFESETKGNRICLTLKKERFAKALKLRVLGGIATANAGDEGFYILPRNIEMNGEILVRFGEREDAEYYYDKPIMSIYGIKTPDICALVRYKRNYRIGFELNVKNDVYGLCLLYDFTEHDAPYEDIKIEIIKLPRSAGYAEMAACERNIRLERGEIDTLAEKCRRPAVEYARKYPLIRIRMGWKVSPAQIIHQTKETEPEMFAACTFDRACEIADKLKELGVEGAELQLVGWNQSGHDGAFPQLFPADARLGGNEGLKKAIKHIKKLGYRISLHTNLLDSYEVADSFTWDDVVEKRDGSYKTGGPYSGGLAYHVCPERQIKNCLRDMPEVLKLGLNGIVFNDVISIVEPDDCHSKEHPHTLSDGIESVKYIMRYMRTRFGAFSSEGSMDFALGSLDYALYISFGDGFGHKVIPIIDECLPFFEMIYHGILLYNPTSPTVNAPIKTPEDRLTAIMRGGRPTLYVYSKFRTGGAKNWMGEVDLTTEDAAALDMTCRIIADWSRECGAFADRQLVYMTDYKIGKNGVHIATYADGARMIGNFNPVAVEFEGETIEAFGYIVK